MKLTETDMSNINVWFFKGRAEKAVTELLQGTTKDIDLSDKAAKAASDAVEALTKAMLIRADQLALEVSQ